MFFGSCHRVRTYKKKLITPNITQILKQIARHLDRSPPVQECCPCATERSWGFHHFPWLNWQLWAKHPRCQKPWTACPPSKSVWSASTSPRRSGRLTGSQKQSRRSRRLCLCSRTLFHWSPQRWTHQTLWWCRENTSAVKSAAHPKEPMLHVYCSPTAMPGSELAVWTSSLPWCLTTQLGSIWVVPLGSKWTIWNFRKSVTLIASFSGHTSRISGMLSLSKSSLQASPLPSPDLRNWKRKKRNKNLKKSGKEWLHLAKDGKILG